MTSAPTAAPERSAAARAADATRVLAIGSYNVHSCIGMDGRQDAGRVAQVIAALGCDTVGLQEVDNRAGFHAESMQLEFIARTTGMRAVAGSTIVRHDGHYGNALLTRRPILAVRQHDFARTPFEPRGALDVELDVAGTPVRVIVTHLGLVSSERCGQAEQLLEVLRSGSQARLTVLLGDINEWLPYGSSLRRLRAALGAAPAARTFPVWMPLFALDRIWVQPREALRDFRVQRTPVTRVASDHYPVTALVDVSAVAED